jgi:hypothetical protein
LNTVEFTKYYVITPSTPAWNYEQWLTKFNGKAVVNGFKYNSGTNDQWLSVEALRDQIRIHVDPLFNI